LVITFTVFQAFSQVISLQFTIIRT